MCARFQRRVDIWVYAKLFDFLTDTPTPPSLNIACTNLVDVVRFQDGVRRHAPMPWGFLPAWAKDTKERWVNARSETVQQSKMFGKAYQERRCLILGDGIIEWQTIDRKKLPFLFSLKGERPFAFAGIWNCTRIGTETLESCAILTTSANELFSRIGHDRMPVLLRENVIGPWLDPDIEDAGALRDLLVPYPANEMQSRPISTKFNDVRYKAPASTIIHVDMDAFYASVETRDRPELRGKPVIVGGTKGRGVVCAASYEARKFGVHSAMPIATAQRLCPDGVFLPVRMSHYADVSRQIRSIFLSFTPLVEPLSLDEAFLDVRGCEGLFGDAPQVARLIKDRIRAETGLIASVGVAPNKFLAKLASDHGKPDGYVTLQPNQVTAFLDPLAVNRIWGVGAKGEKRLHGLGIHTIGQLAALSEQELADRLGEVGRHIWYLANGVDDREVVPDREAKSVSTETTFPEDIDDRNVLRVCLLDLVDHLAGRLRHENLRARTFDVKIRSSDFRTITRSVTVEEPTHRTRAIWEIVADLFERSLVADLLPVRLLGVGASKLTCEPIVQGSLFDEPEPDEDEGLDEAIDAIRAQFGDGSIRLGSLLDRPEAE